MSFSGANILVGAFTVTVIAIDRWKSVANTNPNSAPLNYTRAFAVIAAVWLLAFLGKKWIHFDSTFHWLGFKSQELEISIAKTSHEIPRVKC